MFQTEKEGEHRTSRLLGCPRRRWIPEA